VAAANTSDCVLQIIGGTDTLTLSYTDAEDSTDNAASDTASASVATASTAAFTDTNGTSVDTYLLGSSTTGTVFVTVTDADEDTSTSTKQTVGVTITSSQTGDSENLTLTETGNNTGIFRNTTGLAFNADEVATRNNSRLETRHGATLTATYTDDDDSTDVTTDTATIQAGTGMVLLTSTVNKDTAQVGETLLVTVTAKNLTAETLGGVTVKLALPAGFGYRPGSAQLDGSGTADPTSGTPRTFTLGTLTAGQTKTLTFQVLIGSTVSPGTHTATLQATID
jgi:hypothetical protein